MNAEPMTAEPSRYGPYPYPRPGPGPYSYPFQPQNEATVAIVSNGWIVTVPKVTEVKTNDKGTDDDDDDDWPGGLPGQRWSREQRVFQFGQAEEMLAYLKESLKKSLVVPDGAT